MNPGSVLDETKNVIRRRGEDYGEIEDNFCRIAKLYRTAAGCKMDEYDVAMLMVCLKLARIKAAPKKRDSYIDLIAYAAFACELAEAE